MSSEKMAYLTRWEMRVAAAATFNVVTNGYPKENQRITGISSGFPKTTAATHLAPRKNVKPIADPERNANSKDCRMTPFSASLSVLQKRDPKRIAPASTPKGAIIVKTRSTVHATE